MTLDIRAKVQCNLGTVISGNLGDDYVQGSGLVRTQGSVLIDGIISPAIGSRVVFTYTKDGIPRRIPRAVRVLSFFADPFRKTTQVELGCKLTYLSDLTDPIDWTAFNDPDNDGLTEEDARIVTLPISASSVMNKCLQELGLSASANPLTNKFSIQAFDFSPGYVQVLSDLLVSECYFGYLDNNEVLQVRSLQSDPTSSIIFTENDIIDLGPIGSGPLPAETVVVSYSSLRLRDPDDDDDEQIDWEKDISRSTVSTLITYKKDTLGEDQEVTKEIKGEEVVATRRRYKRIADRDVVIQSNTVTQTIAAIAAGSYITEVANYTGRILGLKTTQRVLSYEFSSFKYNSEGDEIERVTSVYKTEGEILSSAGIPFTQGLTGNLIPTIDLGFPGFAVWAVDRFRLPGLFFIDPAYREVSRTIVNTEVVGNYSKTTTLEYVMPYLTAKGQQAISQRAAEVSGFEQITFLMADVSRSKLEIAKQTVDISLKGVNTSQERPSGAALTNAARADGGDPNNGWKTDGSAELVLALGSATAQRRIELSMPYAPDDIFSGPPGGPFTSVRSDVRQKAANYGRVQNRLILGNRNGVSLQTVPEKIPSAPYTGFVINAGGYSTLYRVNAVQWAFDSNGIAASTDALFWGVIGRT